MILARGQAAPLRFLIGVLLFWVVGRGAVLAGWRPGEAPMMAIAGRAVAAAPRSEAPAEKGLVPAGPVVLPVAARVLRIALSDTVETPLSAALVIALAAPEAGPPDHAPVRRLDGGSPAIAALATPPTLAPGTRLSGSAWAFVRGGGPAPPLSPDGQIGGGQAGVRLLYRLAGGLSAAARLSHTIGGPRQSEAALGLDWQPVRSLPAHLTLDRRIALDRGGRSAWALGVAGGVYALPLADVARLDGYVQAGVVGAHARDLYADGAVRVGHELALGAGRSLTLGGGVWGAAQPGAARLEAGPSAVLRLPVADTMLAVALDWRGRVAGRARPHSGVALTVGVDF